MRADGRSVRLAVWLAPLLLVLHTGSGVPASVADLGDELRRVGELIAAGQFEQAEALVQELRGTASEGEAPELAIAAADLHSVWSTAAEQQGRLEVAVQHLEIALELDRKTRPKFVPRHLISLARLNRKLGRADEAGAHAHEAVQIFRELGSTDQFDYNDISELAREQFELGFYADSLDIVELLIERLRASGDREREIEALAMLGLVYSYVGEHERAIELEKRALKTAKHLARLLPRSPLLFVPHAGLGITYAMKATALDDRASCSRDPSEEVRNEFEKAVRELKRAVFEARRWQVAYGRSYVLSALSGALTSLGKFKEARKAAEEALEVAPGATNPSVWNSWLTADTGARVAELEANALLNLGHVSWEMGQPERAVKELLRALTLERRSGHVVLAQQIHFHLMKAWEALGAQDLAIFHGKQMATIVERGGEHFASRETLLGGYRRVHRRPLRQLADLLIRESRLTEARSVLEIIKEKEYEEFLRGDYDGPQARVVFNELEEEVNVLYAERSERATRLGHERSQILAKKTRTPEDEKRLDSIEADLLVAAEAFQDFLSSLEERFAKTPIGGRVVEVREAQSFAADLAETGAGTVALYTIVGDERTWVIVITPNTQTAHEASISAPELARKVFDLRQALQDRTKRPLPLAQELYDILLRSAAGDLDGAEAKTLVWSLDGVLRYLPVAALHDGDHYLVESYNNVIVTPASHSKIGAAEARIKRALGLGVSRAHPGFQELSRVPAELTAVVREEGKIDGVIPGRILLDSEFTKKSMLTALRDDYSVVHIASHFVLKPGREDDSFLLMGDGGHLTLAEIKRLPNVFAGVDLLTLSACDTATGGTGARGIEVEGLAVLAQRQGAKAVLATLWPVSDEATLELMVSFYRSFAKGKVTKAEALRRAQLEFLSKGPLFSHPYYWAPFVLIGNWL